MNATTSKHTRLRKPAKRALLSRRELDVLVLLAEGKRDAQIADVLVLSPRTVNFHVRNIYIKLDAHSRIQAVNAGRRLGLLGRGA